MTSEKDSNPLRDSFAEAEDESSVKIASVLWRHLEASGRDACDLWRHTDGWSVRGTSIYRERAAMAHLR